MNKIIKSIIGLIIRFFDKIIDKEAKRVSEFNRRYMGTD